ncbi:hypothetical protein QYE76_036591 [Lolium multiflorum]|uniref:Uncharacterized protein n=1 Tax=Lolium multiflorum TaxID=4521 RepID=A0AAD8VQ99_LOLMU|nr:hypothetical protein QYE76_036591 [Lolium multiflorum]
MLSKLEQMLTRPKPAVKPVSEILGRDFTMPRLRREKGKVKTLGYSDSDMIGDVNDRVCFKRVRAGVVTFLAGYISQKILNNGKGYYPLETSFVPTPRSVFGTSRRPLGSFLPEAAACLLSRAVPLVSRCGLLLMRLISARARPASVLQLAVCNMLTDICELLPPLDCNWRCNHTGYAILAAADYTSNREQQPSGNPVFFKVLIIDNHNIYQPLNVHTFSSQEARWSTPTKHPFDAMAEGDLLALRHPEPFVCNGTAHWLVLYQCGESFYTCTPDIDMKMCCISLTRVEIPEEHLLSWSADS